MKTIKLTNLKSNKIKNVYLKVERKKSVFLLCGCLIFVLIFSLGVFAFGSNDITNNYAYAFNPINTLYNNSNDVIFTATSLNNVANKTLKFIVPVKCNTIENENGTLRFLVDNSIMVKACEDGVVTNLGVSLTGEKFIEIKHNTLVTSRYSNIDITGVVINQMVKKGKDIATAKTNQYVTLSVFVNGVSQNLSVNKNQVTWES